MNKIILKKQTNGYYKTDIVSFIKPMKESMDIKLNGLDQIMFNIFTLQATKEGFAEDEVKTLSEWMKEKLNCEVVVHE